VPEIKKKLEQSVATAVIVFCCWCQDAISVTKTRQRPTLRWWHVMNCKGFGRKRSFSNRGTVSEFTCREWEKLRKPVRTACGPTEIRTRL